MNPVRLRRWSYRLAAALGVVYVVYVIALKMAHRVTGGPLGEVGEFLLVLCGVTAFAVGLFADEAARGGASPSASEGSPE
jgi:hypothetical protein